MNDLQILLSLGCKMVRLAPRSKRPTMGGWQNWGTDDLGIVENWIRQGLNVGLLLGPESGVIDVESDTPEGEDLAQHLGLHKLNGPGLTPTWRSARGAHRLYRWEPWMPETATIDVGGLELRIGGRAAQSVLPPSMHPGGAAYRWEIRPWVETSGRSCIAEAPESLRELLEGAFAGRGGR
jgi:hypothetical protein